MNEGQGALTADLSHLRAALAVAENSSFRGAADATGIRQSVLSRRVKRLEDEIGVSIFQRGKGGTRPTTAGVSFLKGARQILASFAELLGEAGHAGAGASGRVALGLQTSLSSGRLRGLLDEFIGQHPAVELTFYEDRRSTLLAALNEGTLDVAILIGEPSETQSRNDSHILWNELISVALPSYHRLAESTVVTWSDLAEEIMILPERDAGLDLHDSLFARVAPLGAQPTIRRQFLGRDNILSLVGLGQGIAIVCDTARGLQFPGVVLRELHANGGRATIPSVAQWDPTRDNPTARRLVALLKVRSDAQV